MARETLDALAAAGHDVEWVRNWPTNPPDHEILTAAEAANRILLTLDKDFGELAVALGRPHAGIVRLHQLSVDVHAIVCLQIIERHGKELLSGAIVTAQPGRIRVRPSD